MDTMLTSSLQTCGVGNAGAEALAAALELSNGLTTIDLGVSWQRVNSACMALTYMVQGNVITSEGAQALAVALQQNSSLTMLELSVRLT